MLTFFKRIWWRLIRFGFRLLYNELAFTYDCVSWVVSLGEWRAWIRAVLPHLHAPHGSTILEIAHGTGNLQLDLLEAGYQPVGIDLSRAMGRIASRKLRRQGKLPSLIRARAQSLPFADGMFAAIACTFPAPFILESETLRELYRVLDAGGRLVIVPNAVFTGGDPAQKALEVAYRITGQRTRAGLDWRSRFTDVGFEVEIATCPARRSYAQVIIALKPVTVP
ncbi:MAG: hypothetical protein OHK0023_26370 [Anaerolineae bacterium]